MTNVCVMRSYTTLLYTELCTLVYQEVLEFWMAQGVDGFYMDGAHVFFEVDDLGLDEPEQEEVS